MCAAEPQGCDFRRVPRGALRTRRSRQAARQSTSPSRLPRSAVTPNRSPSCRGVATAHVEIVREEQAHAARDLVRRGTALLVDQPLRIAVVAHRDRQVHPRPARDQVGAEHDAAVATDVGEREARRVAVGELERDARAERRRLAAPSTSSSRPLVLEQLRQLRNERRAIARMRRRRRAATRAGSRRSARSGTTAAAAALPRTPRAVRPRDRSADGSARRRRRPRAARRAPRANAAARARPRARRNRAFELRLEERADAGLEQHRGAVDVVDEQAAARELDPVLCVRQRATSATARAARCRTSRRRRAAGGYPPPTTVASAVSSSAALAAPNCSSASRA